MPDTPALTPPDAHSDLEQVIRGVCANARYRLIDPNLVQRIAVQELSKGRKIKEAVKKSVEERYQYIQEQITTHNLDGYHFYIYAVPFIKKGDISLDSTRKKIIEHIQ